MTNQILPASINEPPGEIPTEAPVITALDPVACDIGSEDFTLHVTGENFFTLSVIHFAGHDEPTKLEPDGTLSTGVKPQLWTTPVVVKVSVHNGQLVSNEVDFEFDAPAVARETKGTKADEYEYDDSDEDEEDEDDAPHKPKAKSKAKVKKHK